MREGLTKCLQRKEKFNLSLIAIIDYGVGNLRSVEKAFEKMGFLVKVTSNSEKILQADGVILPGVGAFANCLKNLEILNLKDVVLKVIKEDKPLLGICLGLQILFSVSEENGISPGLDALKGRVVKLPSGVKIPHMGWNQINKKTDSPIFKGVSGEENFYFVHSYYVVPEDKNIVSTTTNYGLEFTSSIWKGNIFGVQFHTEKSGESGLKILKNFGEIVKNSKRKGAAYL